jgi:phosphoribosylanthranilate isomerase
MWLKICGITRIEDAEAAVEAGADAIGFVFFEGSPRRVTSHQARSIASMLSASVERAGVFVDESRDRIRRIFDEAGLTWVQLHGNEDAAFASSLGVPWIKAMRIRDAIEEAAVARFAAGGHGGRVLLDAFKEGSPGGTGTSFDWDLAGAMAGGLSEATASGSSAATGPRTRLILAGGLTPANVGEAVRRARPFGVDVSSGVERRAGIKDATKLASFAAAIGKLALRPDADGASL